MALAESLAALGRKQASVEAFVNASNADPAFLPAAIKAGQILLQSGRTVDAIPFLRRARTLMPHNSKVLLGLTRALTALGQTAEAAQLADELATRHSNDPQVCILQGQISLTDGNMDEAKKWAKRALELDGANAAALALLAEAATDIDAPEILELIEKEISIGKCGQRGLAALRFSAARLCDSLQHYEAAFDHYLAANSTRRDLLRQQGIVYDRKSMELAVERQIAAYGRGGTVSVGGSESEVPVFVVGMARSGTTLTEQILASHPKIAGGGELTEIGRIASRLTREFDYPAHVPADAFSESAASYLMRLREIDGSALRVTDKMPGNVINLGLIARMFPRARIIHCRRDPMDTCISCFAQDFSFRGDAWTTDLGDIGHVYCQYRRIMSHWREVLPKTMILDLDYEDIVVDLEVQARRIIDFVGVDWDDACLRYYENERAVATPSRTQVRQPLYASSVGKWKRYEAGVAPLIEALAACGCAPED
jgi:tetratricopeptide (TPR) repeat protein